MEAHGKYKRGRVHLRGALEGVPLGSRSGTSAKVQRYPKPGVGNRHHLHFTHKGFLHLSILGDVFSRRIVAWASQDKLETSLVENPLKMVLFARQPKAALLHHSDRGSQFARHDYRTLLEERGITLSMSRKANCYDNAMKESFFATLKNECAAQPLRNRAQARLAIFESIEVWYTRQRLGKRNLLVRQYYR